MMSDWEPEEDITLLVHEVRESPTCSPHYPASIALAHGFDGHGNLVVLALDWRASVAIHQALADGGGEPVEVTAPRWSIVSVGPAFAEVAP